MAQERYVSVMEEHPEYVHAIGMISIELADLEVSFADLLAVMLDIDTDMAQAIYFSPKVVIPRLEVLRNVHRVLHPIGSIDEEEVKVIRRKLKSLCERAGAVMGQRNSLLHATWGVADGKVYYGALPLKEGSHKAIKLEEVKRVVDKIRRLNDDVYDLVDLIGIYKADDGASGSTAPNKEQSGQDASGHSANANPL